MSISEVIIDTLTSTSTFCDVLVVSCCFNDPLPPFGDVYANECLN